MCGALGIDVCVPIVHLRVITLITNPMIALAIPLIIRRILIMIIRKFLDAHFEPLGPRPHMPRVVFPRRLLSHGARYTNVSFEPEANFEPRVHEPNTRRHPDPRRLTRTKWKGRCTRVPGKLKWGGGVPGTGCPKELNGEVCPVSGPVSGPVSLASDAAR